MTLDAANIVQLIFAFHAGFFGLLSIRIARLRSFALLLLTFAVHMTFNLLAESGNLGAIPNVTSAFGFAYGPLIYLFVRDITRSTRAKSKRDLLHAIPFLVAMPFSPSNLLFDIVGFLSVAAYLAVTYRYIRCYHAAVANTQPDSNAKVDWLSKTFIAFVAIATYDAGRIFLSHRHDEFHNQLYYLITLGAAFLTVNWLTYKTLRFRELFSGLTKSEFALDQKDNEKALPALSAEEVEQAQNALDLLSCKKLYLNPNFRLAHFAQATSLEARQLSTLIHRHTGERFPQIVNKLRVAHAQKLIASAAEGPCNFLMISYDAGFNSKSSFNQLFKQITGQTPSEYRRSLSARP